MRFPLIALVVDKEQQKKSSSITSNVLKKSLFY